MRIVRIVRESVDRRVDGHDGGPKLGRQPFETCQRSLPRSAQRLKLRNNKKPKEQNMKQEIWKLYIHKTHKTIHRSYSIWRCAESFEIWKNSGRRKFPCLAMMCLYGLICSWERMTANVSPLIPPIPPIPPILCCHVLSISAAHMTCDHCSCPCAC